MTSCFGCTDPVVFGHQMNGCRQTAVPAAGYTPGQVCDYDCPHQRDPLEKQAAARMAALRHLERWTRLEAS